MYSYFLSYETSVRWELFSPIYEETDKKETKWLVSGHIHTLWDKSDFALTGSRNWHLLISTSKSDFTYHCIATTWISVLRHCCKTVVSSWSSRQSLVSPSHLCVHGQVGVLLTHFNSFCIKAFPVQYLLLQGQCVWPGKNFVFLLNSDFDISLSFLFLTTEITRRKLRKEATRNRFSKWCFCAFHRLHQSHWKGTFPFCLILKKSV